jgi:LmbE family N-acetylglucosaminyl deacetylase
MIDTTFSKKRILSFSAHPDDEIGGAGGLLLKAKKNGSALKLSLCMDPAEPRPEKTIKIEREDRLAEFTKVAGLLGAESSYLELPRYAPVNLETILPLVKEIRSFKPDIVLTLAKSEFHADHRIVSSLTMEAVWQAGRSAFPECGLPHKTQTILMYEADCPMPDPTFLLDISDLAEEKDALLGLYASQIARKNLIKAEEGINAFRGLMYRAGTRAEAYKIHEFYYG